MKIEIKDITFEYSHQIPVLQNISLTFNEGELVAIVGRNGAGKTTLAMLIIGILKFSKGDIIFDGLSIKHKSIAEIASKIGFVFQNPNTMIFTQKVHDELKLSLQKFNLTNEEKEKRIQEMYDFFGLLKYQNTHPRLLSRGEKQKLSIATAIVQHPEAIILDEPFSGIDGKQKNQIRDFLVTLKQQGKLIIIITHDLDSIIEYADRIIALENTSIAFDGRPAEFFSDIKSLDKIGLIESNYLSMLNRLKLNGLPKEIIKTDDLLNYFKKKLLV